MRPKYETLLFIAWATTLVATLGSLFFSEVLGYTPCELCWYQRILMYPMVIIYGAALVKNQVDIAMPGLVLSGIGLFTSLYHYILQKVPSMHSNGGSCGIVPCNSEYINIFGFITIPFLAGTAFLIVVVIHLILLLEKRRNQS